MVLALAGHMPLFVEAPINKSCFVARWSPSTTEPDRRHQIGSRQTKGVEMSKGHRVKMIAFTAVGGVLLAGGVTAIAGAQTAPAASTLVGWGGENGGTTGGAGGETVKANTPEAFLEAIANPEPLVIQVEGMLELPLREPSEILPEDAPERAMHDVTSNKTIEGVGPGAGISGGGLNIGLQLAKECTGEPIATECTILPDQGTSPPADAIRNVIVRNMTFAGSPDDNVNIQQFTQNVWIDHNDFSDAADGALDIKRGSDFVTVSYNHFHDQDKVSLVGHNDNNNEQDVGRLRVTYHHNFFEGVGQRNPRVRFGNPVHVFNNYYKDVNNYGVASTMDAGVLVEANFFEDVEDPFHLSEGDSGPGTIQAKDNFFEGGGPEGEGSGGAVAAIPYAYTPDPAEQVKDIVTAEAGPQ